MKIYQNIDLPNLNIISGTKDSKFYNESRWNTFIKPHLPDNCENMTFIEFGSNCGLFLKMAKESGFRNVIGVEKSATHHKLAVEYRNKLGMDYTLINKSIDANFDVDSLPVADYILMSLFHYHLKISDFLLFLDKLLFKARNIIVVSSDTYKRYWRADGSHESVRNYFKHWKEAGYVGYIEKGDDPVPRDIFSFRFESDLKRVKLDELFTIDKKKKAFLTLDDSYMRLANLVVSNEQLDPRDTYFYKELVEVYGEDKNHFGLVKTVLEDMYSMKNEGIKYPILVFPTNQIADGGHRATILKALGYEYAIVREIR